MCQPALVLIILVPVLNKVEQAPVAPPPLATGLPGASNSLVDFIMHEYLHKYFENIKKTRIFFIRNMRPLSIREALPAGGCGGSFHRLW